MSRLIDADKLKNVLLNSKHWIVKREDFVNVGFSSDQVMFTIDKQPTVDAVEVVRCKDCYWSYDCKGHRHCNFMAGDIIDDWYCVHGKERKTDDRTEIETV